MGGESPGPPTNPSNLTSHQHQEVLARLSALTPCQAGVAALVGGLQGADLQLPPPRHQALLGAACCQEMGQRGLWSCSSAEPSPSTLLCSVPPSSHPWGPGWLKERCGLCRFAGGRR